VEVVDLLAQLRGHGRAGSLVSGVHVVPEGLSLGVEHHRHVIRVVFGTKLANHAGYAVGRSGVVLAGGLQLRQRVERPVQV
jgi:hypothetical protein